MQLRVAIVGIAGAVGSELGSQCDADPEIGRILGIDRVAPRPVPEKSVFAKSQPETPLGELFREHGIQLAAYLSPFPCAHSASEPGDARALAAFLEGCAACSARAVVVASGAWAYDRADDGGAGGAGGRTEGAQHAAHPEAWAAADLERERQVAEWARAHPDAHVCLARLATVVGPRTRGLVWRLGQARKIVALAGVDPVLQFLHVEDAGLAIFRLLKSGRSGVFNVCPDEALRLSEVARAFNVPVRRVSKRVAGALTGPGRYLYLDRLAGLDEGLLQLFQNRLLLANRKLKRDVGYRFKYGSDGALADQARLARGADRV